MARKIIIEKEKRKCFLCKEDNKITWRYDNESSDSSSKWCLDCTLKKANSLKHLSKEGIEELKKQMRKNKEENKENYQKALNEQKEKLECWEQAKKDYPEHKGKIEKIIQVGKEWSRKIIPEEDLKELGIKKPTNWVPWIIGGSILGVIIIGAIAYFWWRSSKQKKEPQE